MGKSKKTPLELGGRERQIYETVLAIGEASVSDVKARLENPPSYSAVRATMNLLVDKNWLKHRQVGLKYEVVQAVHDSRIAGNVNHDVALFGLKSFREVRQAVGPHLTNGLYSDRFVRQDCIEHDRVVRVISDESIQILRCQSS